MSRQRQCTHRRVLGIILLAVGIITLTHCADDSNDAPTAPLPMVYDTTAYALCMPGEFSMGASNVYAMFLQDAKPVHTVKITRPFIIGKTEVSQAQYTGIMGSNPSTVMGDTYPVTGVTWENALLFCNALSKQEGVDTCYRRNGSQWICDFDATGYRLPTEAEWEYASRAGTNTHFYTGIMYQFYCEHDASLDLAGWYCANAGGTPHAVAQKTPNGLGLYDTHGNVGEWCWDWYDANYYTDNLFTDPTGPTSGSNHSVRGGCWNSYIFGCMSAARYEAIEDISLEQTGLRVARTYRP